MALHDPSPKSSNKSPSQTTSILLLQFLYCYYKKTLQQPISGIIKIHGFVGSASSHARNGIATLVRNDLTATTVACSSNDSELKWNTISINNELTIVNV